jgi:hypothetical protein
MDPLNGPSQLSGCAGLRRAGPGRYTLFLSLTTTPRVARRRVVAARDLAGRCERAAPKWRNW